MEKIPDQKVSPGYTLVSDAAGLALVTEKLKGTARVGMDTEADSLHHYFEKVCLIQLSFSGENYVIDPLAGYSLTDFLEELSRKELIFQGADFDLRILKKSFGFRPKAPVFDTMLAAQVLGYEKIGLAALVEKFFGVVLSKSSQKADWSRRPLTEKMLTYAADDTRYLEAITDAMTAELQLLNRMAWHRECCERAVKSSDFTERNDDREPWRIKGSSKMPPAEAAFLRELWKWRDEEARKRDRPPFMILRNEDLLELASWRAQNRELPLKEGPAFLARFSGDKRERLESAVLAAENLKPSEWPVFEKKREWREEKPDAEKVEQLIAACRTLAEELRIQPSFLASRSAVTAVILHKPRTLEQVMEAGGLMRWQAQLLMPVLTGLRA